ncbi:MAG: hypothetical protein ACJAS4_000974 [Bacteriovoracaceae bacterium]|jgi:hypothetical protein
MNLEKRFIEIKEFLAEHQTLLDTEVLELFPFDNLPYTTWISELIQLSQEDLINLENNLDHSLINSSHYKSFLMKIQELTQIEMVPPSDESIPNHLKRKLSLKKQHEIKQIKKLLNTNDSENIIDIGSGAGHLSSLLLLGNNKTSLCIDCEEKYQQIGIDKLKREAPEILERIQFKTSLINENFKVPQVSQALLIGLHACGDLSVNIIKGFSKSSTEELLSFGCCYHKLSPSQVNISKLSKVHYIKLTNHALTMASKSFKSLNYKDFMTREKVKKFRYTIHLFMHEKLKLGFKTLGNAKAEDYNGTFSDYVKKYLIEAKNIKSEEIETYFTEKEPEVSTIISLGIIRSHLSRLVELYLILDRAIYLKEKNCEVQIKEVFNKSLSPRNIGIQAKRI